MINIKSNCTMIYNSECDNEYVMHTNLSGEISKLGRSLSLSPIPNYSYLLSNLRVSRQTACAGI